MPKKLTDLKINRVAICDAGSNPEADVSIFKRKEPVEKATFDELREAQAVTDKLYDVCSMVYDLESAVYSSLYADGDRASEVRTSVKQFGVAVESVLDSLLKKSAEKTKIEEAITKFKALTTPVSKQEETVPEEKKTTEAPAATPTPEVTDDVMKTLPESVRKMIEGQKEQIALSTAAVEKANATAAEAKAIAKEEKEKREFSEVCKRVDDEFRYLPGTNVEKAKALQAIEKIEDEAVRKTALAIFKAGDKAVETALLSETGRVAKTGSAAEIINSRAAEIVAKGEAKTIAKATQMVLDRDPALYQRHKDEQN